MRLMMRVSKNDVSVLEGKRISEKRCPSFRVGRRRPRFADQLKLIIRIKKLREKEKKVDHRQETTGQQVKVITVSVL